MTGRWAGKLTQYSSPVSANFVLNLTQKGNTVTGTAEIQNSQVAAASAVMHLVGTINDNSFHFDETKIVNSKGAWSLIKGDLAVLTVGNSVSLTGTWQSLQGAPVAGQITLQKQ